MGGMTIVAGYAQDDVAATGGTTTGVELSMALGGGTLSVGTFDTNKNLAVATPKVTVLNMLQLWVLLA